MHTDQIMRTFDDFFQERGHRRIDGGSLLRSAARPRHGPAGRLTGRGPGRASRAPR